jgi:prepilin-type N-terminal cleavage/methylation domain-containing protein
MPRTGPGFSPAQGGDSSSAASSAAAHATLGAIESERMVLVLMRPVFGVSPASPSRNSAVPQWCAHQQEFRVQWRICPPDVMSKGRRRGFSLTEMVVVMGIMMILYAMIFIYITVLTRTKERIRTITTGRNETHESFVREATGGH